MTDQNPEKPPEPAGQGPSLLPVQDPAGFWMLVVLLCFLVVAGIAIFLPFWGPIFIAVVLATILYPTYQRILRLIGEKRHTLASLLTCTLFSLVILVPLTWAVVNVLSEAPGAVRAVASRGVKALDNISREDWVRDLYEKYPAIEERAIWMRAVLMRVSQPSASKEDQQEKGEAPILAEPQEEASSTMSREGFLALLQDFTQFATSLLAGAFGLAFRVFLMLFLLFYFLRDGPQILASIRRGLPVDPEDQERVIVTFQQVSRSMIRGTFLTALVQGIVAGITYLFLGIPALFWGAMTALCALVPALGTALVTVPITLTFALNEQWVHAIVMAVVAAVIGFMDNILRPILVQGGLHLHTAWILLSMLGGVGVFGALGLVVGPMVVVLIRTVLALVLESEEVAPLEEKAKA